MAKYCTVASFPVLPQVNMLWKAHTNILFATHKGEDIIILKISIVYRRWEGGGEEGREGGREGERERGREGVREGGREGGSVVASAQMGSTVVMAMYSLLQ